MVSVVYSDMLRVRIQTEAVVERAFDVQGRKFIFHDVAGQRDKRQRWVPFVQHDLSALIFIFSVASYDLLLAEDSTVNRFADAMTLFDTIMQNSLLNECPTIVMLNKIDLFTEKIKKIQFSTFVPGYTGKNTGSDVLRYISDEFTQRNKNPQREVVIHLTTGTDIKLMTGVIKSVQ